MYKELSIIMSNSHQVLSILLYEQSICTIHLMERRNYLINVYIVNRKSSLPIQHQQESSIWGVVRGETLFSANNSIVK